MSGSVCLSEVPGRFLDQRNWKSLRKTASKEIIALTYINAPHPGGEDLSDFFWDRSGSHAAAMRCYRTGRSLPEECRSLLSEGKLTATGVGSTTKRRTPIFAKEWLNLWPMFATNKAVGPNSDYGEVMSRQGGRRAGHRARAGVGIAVGRQSRRGRPRDRGTGPG
jgi:hypothetical protein